MNEASGISLFFLLPAIAHILAIVIFIQLLGTNKRLEMLKKEIAEIKKLLASKQVG